MSVDELERPTASPVPDLDRVVEVTRELVDLAGDAQLTKLAVHTGGVSWEIEGCVVAATPVPGTAAPVVEPAPLVVAPAVGVFTRSADLQVGDPVATGQPLGQVEAMRMCTDVLADRDGTLAEVHATDGEIVEYGQPLFTIAPS